MTFAISDTTLWDKINNAFGNRGGAYKVVAIKNEKPIIINRLLGADTNGILYIGKAINYLDRVITLKKSLDRGLSLADALQVVKQGEVITKYTDTKPHPCFLMLGFVGG